MSKPLPRAGCVLALTLSSCADDADSSRAPPEARPIDLPALGPRSLDSLLGDELIALCRAELERSDPCLEYGVVTTTTEAGCVSAAASCRSELADQRGTTACPALELDPGTCSVTVEQYLACLDAWKQALTCAEAGYLLGPPEPCRTAIDGCPRLADQFMLRGKLHQCTAQESQGKPVHTGDDIVGADGCRPVPARFIVLGDSIANCTGVDEADCGPFLIAEHLRTTVAPDIGFEMHAREGARVADLLAQAETVAPGPGHLFVFIYALGNDMLNGFFDNESLSAGFRGVFDHFEAKSAFPDGATFLLNTQYTTNDECYVPGATITAPAVVLLNVAETNRRVILDVATARVDALAIDQYPDFLGHGVNANLSGCPHCGSDNSRWIDDGLHPNVQGHAHVAAKWIVAIDRMVGGTCASPAR